MVVVVIGAWRYPHCCMAFIRAMKQPAALHVCKTRGPWALTFCLRTNLAIGQNARSCPYILFLPQGVKIERIFHSTGSSFRDTCRFSKLPYLGMQLSHLAKVPEVAHIPSFRHRGSKLSLFSLYGQWFLRYGLIFKIAIFGHETWPLAKVPDAAHTLSFYPNGSKMSLF